MEDLAPPLELLWEVIFAIENGNSIRSGVLNYLSSHLQENEFLEEVRIWLILVEQQKDLKTFLIQQKTIYRTSLFEILSLGLQGKAILNSLKQLAQEVLEQSELQMDSFIKMLPFHLLLPLLLLHFPALLLLLLGPLMIYLNQLLGDIG